MGGKETWPQRVERERRERGYEPAHIVMDDEDWEELERAFREAGMLPPCEGVEDE